MLENWLSREPATAPVGSLGELQANLVRDGYSDLTPDGIWSPAWGSALRRWERDGRERLMGGEAPGSASPMKILQYLGYTLPSAVFSGVVGTAKGIYEQGAETAERVGALGGAAGGALIGTAIAPGVGTVAGAAIGGAIGFFGDLFGDDDTDEEKEQDPWHAFLDALTPYDEYKREGGAKAFFEDLGFVLTAASAAKGVGMAVGAVRTAGAAPSLIAKGASEVPKFGVSRALGAAIRRPAIAGGVVGAAHGALTDGLEGAVKEGALGVLGGAALGKVLPTKNIASGWLNFVGKHGLGAQMTRPGLKAAQGVYTGLSVTQIGGRVFGGMLNPNETTTIEGNIATAPKLPGGTAVDWAVGALLYPTQFLPFRAGELAAGLNKTLGVTHLEPWIHTLQKSAGGTLSRGKAREAFFKLGDSPAEVGLIDGYHRLDAALNAEAGRRVHQIGASADPLSAARKFKEAKAVVFREMANDPKMASQLFQSTLEDPTVLMFHLTNIEGVGSGISRWGNFHKDSQLLEDVQKAWMRGDVDLDVGDIKLVKGGDMEWLTKSSKARDLDAKARMLRRDANKPNLTIEERSNLLNEAGSLSDEAKALRKGLSTPKAAKDARPNLMLARTDYLTRDELLAYTTEYEKLATDYEKAFKNFQKSQSPATQQVAEDTEDALMGFLDNAENREALPTELISEARKPKFLRRVKSYLSEYAEIQAGEVKGLAPEVQERLTSHGYKAVATGDDVLKINDVPRLLEVSGVADYSRRQAFFANIRNLGLDPARRADDSLWGIKTAHMAAETNTELSKFGIGMNGRTALKRINKYMHDRNHPGKVSDENVSSIGPIIVREKPGKGTKIELFKVDIRELKVDDIVDALDLDRRLAQVGSTATPQEVGKAIYKAMHRGSAFGGEAHLFSHPVVAARDIARGLGINGLPGLSDFIRTADFSGRGLATTAGAAGGALVGMDDGDEFSLQGALTGAVVGGAAAYGATKFPRLNKLIAQKFDQGTYGYLPQKLHRLNMSLRYTLSPTFDLGRYVEQNMLGAVRNEIPVIVRPHRFVERREWNKSPYRAGGVSGEQAWKDAVKFWDEVNGTTAFQITDDIERRMFQKGLFGFSPRHHEAAQAWVLYQRGMSAEKIRDSVYMIGRYGTGRSALEKSANFIFFPLSFQKKLLNSLGDWMFSAPARALLIHENLRMFEAFGATDKFGDFIEKHFPLMDELKQLNNLAYGASPGRFFLEGVADHKTDVGTAMQVISSVLAPSGAAAPLASAAGKAADRTIHAFVPIVVTGEKLSDFGDIVDSFLPLARDVRDYADVLSRQGTAIREGADPYYQQSAYLEGKKAVTAKWDSFASAFGYSDSNSLFQSAAGQVLRPRFDQEVFALQEENPTGWEMSRTFTEDGSVKKKLLYDLANDDDRSFAEEGIRLLGEVEEAGRRLAQTYGTSMETVYPLVMAAIRRNAGRFAKDRRFREMFDTFFADDYGPLERLVA